MFLYFVGYEFVCVDFSEDKGFVIVLYVVVYFVEFLVIEDVMWVIVMGNYFFM